MHTVPKLAGIPPVAQVPSEHVCSSVQGPHSMPTSGAAQASPVESSPVDVSPVEVDDEVDALPRSTPVVVDVPDVELVSVLEVSELLEVRLDPVPLEVAAIPVVGVALVLLLVSVPVVPVVPAAPSPHATARQANARVMCLCMYCPGR